MFGINKRRRASETGLKGEGRKRTGWNCWRLPGERTLEEQKKTGKEREGEEWWLGEKVKGTESGRTHGA